MAAKKSTRADPEEALALMQQGRVRGRSRRSPAVIWMQENRAVLERGFARSGPDWAKLAAYLGEHGIFDGDGNPPTALGLRQAWYRVRKASATTPAPAAQKQKVAPATPGIEPEGQPPAARPRFGFATLRNHTPSPPPKPQPPPKPEPAKQDADAVVRRLLGNKASKVLPPDHDDE